MADRFDRGKLTAVVELARVAVLAVLVLAIVTHWVSIVVVLAALFLLGTAEVFSQTASGSMLPSMVDHDDLILGNSRIITGVMQVILNVIDFGENAQDAIDQPRFHHQWKPDTLYLEEGISPDTVALLKGMGYHITQGANQGVANVEDIVIDKGWLTGGSDGRSGGKAAGY